MGLSADVFCYNLSYFALSRGIFAYRRKVFCVQARLFCVQAKASSHGPQTPTPQLSHRSVAILSPSEAGAHGARVQNKRKETSSPRCRKVGTDATPTTGSQTPCEVVLIVDIRTDPMVLIKILMVSMKFLTIRIFVISIRMIIIDQPLLTSPFQGEELVFRARVYIANNFFIPHPQHPQH